MKRSEIKKILLKKPLCELDLSKIGLTPKQEKKVRAAIDKEEKAKITRNASTIYESWLKNNSGRSLYGTEVCPVSNYDEIEYGNNRVGIKRLCPIISTQYNIYNAKKGLSSEDNKLFITPNMVYDILEIYHQKLVKSVIRNQSIQTQIGIYYLKKLTNNPKLKKNNGDLTLLRHSIGLKINDKTKAFFAKECGELIDRNNQLIK